MNKKLKNLQIFLGDKIRFRSSCSPPEINSFRVSSSFRNFNPVKGIASVKG